MMFYPGLGPIDGQHFRAIKVHDPIRVRAVVFREFDFCPFGNKVSQYLRLNGPPWFVFYVERKELDGPFRYPSRSVTVVYYVFEWYFGGQRPP